MNAKHVLLAGFTGLIIGTIATIVIDNRRINTIRKSVVEQQSLDRAISNLHRSLRILSLVKDSNEAETTSLLEMWVDSSLITLAYAMQTNLEAKGLAEAYQAALEHRRAHPFVRTNSDPDSQAVQRMVDRIVRNEGIEPDGIKAF